MDIRIEGGGASSSGTGSEETTVCAWAEWRDRRPSAGGNAARRETIDGARPHGPCPGVVDIHGDAFERPVDAASGRFTFAMELLRCFDTDRQVIANGHNHGVFSRGSTLVVGNRGCAAPGKRGLRDILAGHGRNCWPRLGADTKFHLRHDGTFQSRRGGRKSSTGSASPGTHRRGWRFNNHMPRQ